MLPPRQAETDRGNRMTPESANRFALPSEQITQRLPVNEVLQIEELAKTVARVLREVGPRKHARAATDRYRNEEC